MNQIFDPCAIVIYVIFAIIFISIYSTNKSNIKNLCIHAYNDGYYEGSKGIYDIPVGIETKYSYVISKGSFRDHHKVIAVHAWKLGNEHGKTNHRRLLDWEIYKLVRHGV